MTILQPLKMYNSAILRFMDIVVTVYYWPTWYKTYSGPSNICIMFLRIHRQPMSCTDIN